VRKLKRWLLLSIAGGLAVLAGSRMQEMVGLDNDNMGKR
jgi:hypothetical protein